MRVGVGGKGVNAVERGHLLAVGQKVAILRIWALADPMSDIVLYVADSLESSTKGTEHG